MSIVLSHPIQGDVQWIIANATASGGIRNQLDWKGSSHVMRETTRLSKTPGLNRRRFCGAAAATVAAGPLGLPGLPFCRKE